MSGHSKWSNIKNKKAAIDSKRSGIFTKMAKAIAVSVKKGGGVGDPTMNFALRLAVDRARAVNMPKENIERAIEKGMGKGGSAEMEELVLEGYGPGGVALVIEAVTDNRNRTVAEIKNILEKHGGRLGEPGSVMYRFERVGEVRGKGQLTEAHELELIDKGMIDFESEGDEFVIYAPLPRMKEIADYLNQAGLTEVGMSIVYRAKEAVESSEAGLERLMEAIDSHEDVQEVYANTIY